MTIISEGLRRKISEACEEKRSQNIKADCRNKVLNSKSDKMGNNDVEVCEKEIESQYIKAQGRNKGLKELVPLKQVVKLRRDLSANDTSRHPKLLKIGPNHQCQ